VRTDKEFESGHVAGAHHIPLGLLKDRLGELKDYKDTPVIMACRSGNRSASGASLLLKQGFKQVHNLSGGMLAWTNANLPVDKGTAKAARKAAKALAKESNAG
jgi:rhodanese-related sulfurtransferase